MILIGRFAPEGSGGDEGIRTLDGLMTHTPLAGERLRPLGHVSVGGTSDSSPPPQPLMHWITAEPQLGHLLTIKPSQLFRIETKSVNFQR